MAAAPHPDDTKLQAAVEALRACHPVAVYGFGSRISGSARPGSDLDFVVLLHAGARLTISERLSAIERIQGLTGWDVDLVVLNEARLPLQFDIIHDGRVLYESSSDARTEAEDIIVRDYLDFRPFLERSFQDAMAAARETPSGRQGGRT